MMRFPCHRAYLLAASVLLACGSNEPSRPPANPSGGNGATGAVNASGGASAGLGSGAGPASGGVAGGSGSTSMGGSAGSSNGGGASTAGGAGACEPEDPTLTFEENCLSCATTDCERCLCSNCVEELQTCAETSGCPEIAACIQASECTGIDCYCGTFDALACAGGQSDGPCKAAILAAPGSREPSLVDPSAGPASDAAIAISTCTQPGASCAESCSADG